MGFKELTKACVFRILPKVKKVQWKLRELADALDMGEMSIGYYTPTGSFIIRPERPEDARRLGRVLSDREVGMSRPNAEGTPVIPPIAFIRQGYEVIINITDVHFDLDLLQQVINDARTGKMDHIDGKKRTGKAKHLADPPPEAERNADGSWQRRLDRDNPGQEKIP